MTCTCWKGTADISFLGICFLSFNYCNYLFPFLNAVKNYMNSAWVFGCERGWEGGRVCTCLSNFSVLSSFHCRLETISNQHNSSSDALFQVISFRFFGWETFLGCKIFRPRSNDHFQSNFFSWGNRGEIIESVTTTIEISRK